MPYPPGQNQRPRRYWMFDPGHAWLVVPASEAKASGANISSFSYLSQSGRTAYLEEDCDAPAFLEAMGIPFREARKWPEYQGNPRMLPMYAEEEIEEAS